MIRRQVYFMKPVDADGPIKIGLTIYPEARRKQLSTNSKCKLEILAYADGERAEEREVHRLFAHLRGVPAFLDTPEKRRDACPTEWFAAAPELLAYIEKVRAKGRLPIRRKKRPAFDAKRNQCWLDAYNAAAADGAVVHRADVEARFMATYRPAPADAA